MERHSDDWQHVKTGLGVIAYSAVCALIGYAFGGRDTSAGAQRLMWVFAAAAFPWGVGILAAKTVFRSDESGQATVANWHWGQVIIATVGVILLAAVGLVGFVATLFLLDQCGAIWQPVCTVGQWTYGVIGVLYAVALVLFLPFVLWWDAFAIRAQRAKLTFEANLKQVFEAGRVKGHEEGQEALRQRLRERRRKRRSAGS